MQAEIRLIGGASFSIDDVDAIARGRCRVALDDCARTRLHRSYELLERLVRERTPVYGLTTGCGPLACHSIDSSEQPAFQRNLVRSHAVSLGPPLPASFVRAAMAVRAQVFAKGFSGVHPATVDILIAMLNARIHPIVRQVGSVGASGDLVELAQIALAVIGEGEVEHDDRTIAAAAALREARIEPLVPRLREGLALMNGTSCHTGAGAVLLARGRRIAAAAELAAALSFEALRGNLEAFAPELQAARPHPGQQAVAARIVRRVRGSKLVRQGESSAGQQDAYTLRCIPQIMGSALDLIRTAAQVIETELDSVTDNPLLIAGSGQVVHGGNFHGQPVAMAIDQLKTAMVELGVLTERRIARLLDPALNAGLPPFLVRGRIGVQSGFMGLQYCASSMAADNAVLSAPASVRSLPTNANNQDVVSMGMVAARQCAHVIDNVERMVAIELLCAAQALDLRGLELASPAARRVNETLRELSPALLEDRPLAAEVEAVCRWIDEGGFDGDGSPEK